MTSTPTLPPGLRRRMPLADEPANHTQPAMFGPTPAPMPRPAKPEPRPEAPADDQDPPPAPPASTPPTPPATPKALLTSKTPGSPCRMVMYHHEHLCPKGTPAIVMDLPQYGEVLDAAGKVIEGSGQFIDVNVMFHGVNHDKLLAAARSSPTGNTVVRIPLYDPLSTAERSEVGRRRGENPGQWCEWPFVPRKPPPKK